MAEPGQRRQPRPRYTVNFLDPAPGHGYDEFIVEIYDNQENRWAEGRVVKFRAGSQPEIRVLTDSDGTARARITFPSRTTVTASAEGQTRSFPDLAGFAKASTNFGKPTREDRKGFILNGMFRVLKKALKQRHTDTGR